MQVLSFQSVARLKRMRKQCKQQEFPILFWISKHERLRLFSAGELKDKVEMRKLHCSLRFVDFLSETLGKLLYLLGCYFLTIKMTMLWSSFLLALTFGEICLPDTVILCFFMIVWKHHVLQSPFEPQCQVLMLIRSEFLKIKKKNYLKCKNIIWKSVLFQFQ